MLAIYHNIFHKTKLYCKWKWHHGIHCQNWGGKLLIQSIDEVAYNKGGKKKVLFITKDQQMLDILHWKLARLFPLNDLHCERVSQLSVCLTFTDDLYKKWKIYQH